VQEAVTVRIRGQGVTSGEWSVDPYHDVFVSDLTALAREARANNQKAILIVYPALYRVGMSQSEAAEYAPVLWDSRASRPEIYRPTMLLELARKHAAVREVAALTGAMLIDAQQAFDDVRGPERRSLFLDAAHLSVLGNQKLGEVLGARLASILCDLQTGS